LSISISYDQKPKDKKEKEMQEWERYDQRMVNWELNVISEDELNNALIKIKPEKFLKK
jgi:hypothetical protein